MTNADGRQFFESFQESFITYVCTVASTDDQTTIENKLHVAGTRCLSSGCGDVLAEVIGRDDHLSLANVVVLEEDNLELVTNVLVLVYHGADAVDEVDNLLSHPVTRRSLATENGNTRQLLLALLRGHGLQSKVAMNDTKDVHLLTLVLVDTLHLHIEERIRADSDTGGALNVVGQSGLV